MDILEGRGQQMTTASHSASLPLHHSNTPCPKCGANRTHSAGTRIRKLEQTRVQMRRCPTCNHQFTDHRFAPQPLDARKSLTKSVGQSRAVPPHPPIPSKRSEVRQYSRDQRWLEHRRFQQLGGDSISISTPRVGFAERLECDGFAELHRLCPRRIASRWSILRSANARGTRVATA